MQSVHVEEARKRIKEIEDIELPKAQAEAKPLLIQFTAIFITFMILMFLSTKNSWVFILAAFSYGLLIWQHFRMDTAMRYRQARLVEKNSLEFAIKFGQAMVSEYRNAPIKPE